MFACQDPSRFNVLEIFSMFRSFCHRKCSNLKLVDVWLTGKKCSSDKKLEYWGVKKLLLFYGFVGTIFKETELQKE